MIKVGGATEIEVKEKKDRVEDALNATRAAVEEGIVPGGGVALLRAKKAVGRITNDNPDVQAGINIVLKALEAPIRQIAENSGVEGSIVVGKILENKSETFGFDAQNEDYVDMIDKGIVDPAKVVRTALQDAASIAGLLVTTEAMVAELPKDKPAMPAMPGGGGMGGMDFPIQPFQARQGQNDERRGSGGPFSFRGAAARDKNPGLLPGVFAFASAVWNLVVQVYPNLSQAVRPTLAEYRLGRMNPGGRCAAATLVSARQHRSEGEEYLIPDTAM